MDIFKFFRKLNSKSNDAINTEYSLFNLLEAWLLGSYCRFNKFFTYQKWNRLIKTILKKLEKPNWSLENMEKPPILPKFTQA